MSKYYRIKCEVFQYKDLPERYHNCTEEERGLTEKCENGKEHAWLLFPSWSNGVKSGGKQYLICLNCYQFSHL